MNQKLFPVCSVIFIGLLGALLTTSCASTHQPQVYQSHLSDQETSFLLAETAGSVSQSLVDLKANEQAAKPPVSVTEPPDPATYGMEVPASVRWNGPVGPLVEQIANMTNYTVRVIGTVPNMPVLVNLNAVKTPIGEILRNASYQCGNRAQIVVFPSTHVIELRYTQT